MNLTDTISEKMSDIFKPQRKFISVPLTTIMLMRGHVYLRNISYYNILSIKIFSRQFREPSDFARFSSIGTDMIVVPHIAFLNDLYNFITSSRYAVEKK